MMLLEEEKFLMMMMKSRRLQTRMTRRYMMNVKKDKSGCEKQ